MNWQLSSTNVLSKLERLIQIGMRKIIVYIGSIFSNHPTNLNANDCNNINFWCPTGMNPIFHHQIKDYQD